MPEEQEQWLLEFLFFFRFFPFFFYSFLISFLSFRATECQTRLDFLQAGSAFAAMELLLSPLMEIKEEAKPTKPKP